MGTPNRREFLTGAAGAIAAGAVLGGAGSVAAGETSGLHTGWHGRPSDLPEGLFSLGVASGDPDHRSVVLWTRLAPDPLNGGGMPDVDVPVRYEVARDDRFRRVVSRGTVMARARWAHSVHLVARDLRPDSWYWYRFKVGDQVSPVGRARTAPAPGRGDSLTFLFASCQNYRHGYYTSWQHAAQEEADLVVHLGDYIYESGVGDPSNSVRLHNSPTVRTLDGYRNRYALYRSDPDLQAAHAACPWAVTWDDHEVHNNYAGLDPTNPAEAEEFPARRAAAYQAWWEHQPVRTAPPTDENLRIYRTQRWGALASVHLLDTRQHRSNQACGTNDWGNHCDERDDPSRSILGADQERWLHRALGRSGAEWDVLANQVIMGAMPIAGDLYNLDQWDGYTAARQRVADSFAEQGTTNPVVITGDVHASAVGEVVTHVGADPVATEFVGTSISSNFGEELIDVAEALIGALPHVRWINARKRGYVRCRATRSELLVDYRLVDTVLEPQSGIVTGSSWRVASGQIGAEPR